MAVEEKLQFLLVVTGLSDKPRVKAYDSWQKLEEGKLFLDRTWKGQKKLDYVVFCLDEIEICKRYDLFFGEVGLRAAPKNERN